MAASVYSMHYETIVAEFGSCPIPMLIGESETGLKTLIECTVHMFCMYVLTILAVNLNSYFTSGKSTAARCAPSLCGQMTTGHLMKTKRTTNSLVIERCCKSTLPFCLDDPKTADGIGELLIDLCNGRQLGNMKARLRTPRSIPIICANFNIKSIQRY